MHERRTQRKGRSKEDFGIILDEYEDLADFGKYKNTNTQIIFVLGTSYFTLLKIYLRPRLRFEIKKEIAIEKLRDRTLLIQRQLLDQISTASQQNIFDVIDLVITKKEQFFVDFFNNARTITPRLHQLKLLPGIGPKKMWNVIEERKREPFVSFEDVIKRTEINDPIGLIKKRIMEELEGNERYYLFITPPPPSRFQK